MLASDVVVGRYAPDFELPGVDGAVHHLRSYLTQFRCVGVVFLSNTCPEVLQHLYALSHLQDAFATKGFQLIGINATDGVRSPADRFEAMQNFATQHRLLFPYLKDETQDVAETFGATHTPQAFLLDQHGIVQYSGNLGLSSNSRLTTTLGQNYGLHGAIANLLQGHPPTTSLTKPTGTPIVWRSRPMSGHHRPL